MRATLTYHSIDASGSAISLHPDAADAHLRWLAGGAVPVLPLDDIAREPPDGPDAVALTFDDAFTNARDVILRMREAGLPVTVFVVGAHVGRTNAWGGRDAPGIPTLPLMDWADLERLASAGVAIASHTMRHPALTDLPPDRVDEELEAGLAALRARLDVNADHLAYPYGAFDADVAARTGRVHRFAHTTDFRAYATGDRILELPRLDAYYLQASGALESWGTARFAARLAWCRTRRAIRQRLPGRRSGPGAAYR